MTATVSRRIVTRSLRWERYAVALGDNSEGTIDMKNMTSVFLAVFVLVVSGCSKTASLENKLEGNWREESPGVEGYTSPSSRDVIVKSGSVAVRSTGHVYMSYQVLDNETLRVTGFGFGSGNSGGLVKVTFPTTTTMIWNRDLSGKLNKCKTFERIRE